nr:immunoglobulin light chain junction region [Macaca mulatta]
CQHTYDAPFTF